MNSKSNQSRGFYFENDLGMAATALMEMFGNDVEERVSERLEEVRSDGNNQHTRFWKTLLDEIRRQRNK